MHWVMQQDIFREDGWKSMTDTLTRFNIPWTEHKVVPFIGEIEPDINPVGPVICFGSYSLRHLAKRKGWTPGVFDLEPYDFTVQVQHWGEHMLNHDAVVTTFENAQFFGEELFIRPANDTKYFAGKVFDKEEFVEWQKAVCILNLDYGNSLKNDTLIQMCTLKKILNEHRFWVVNGKIVTASTYKIGWTVHYQSPVDERFHNYVRERIAEWQPHDAFVIDVCDTPDRIKIVEINTINSSGFYAGDMQTLVFALEEAFNE